MEDSINFEALRRNLIDVVQETQIKLGYAKTPIGLYYPLESLNRLLDTEVSIEKIVELLQEFTVFVKPTLGAVSCSHDTERFCFNISAEGVAYVHDEVKDTGFLKEFIEKINSCHCSLNDILEVFYHYSNGVKYEKLDTEEFDYLIYFEDGIPDEYRYCIKFESEHVTYHRFTKKDFEALGFGKK